MDKDKGNIQVADTPPVNMEQTQPIVPAYSDETIEKQQRGKVPWASGNTPHESIKEMNLDKLVQNATEMHSHTADHAHTQSQAIRHT